MTDLATYLDDQLEDLEPPYESPAHRRIGRALDQYGIPFFHRQPGLVYADGQHHIWRPDFTLPGYNGLVVEYAGTGPPQGNTYRQHREAVYAMNQIPAVFVYARDMSAPSWPETIIKQIRETGSREYEASALVYSTTLAVQPTGAPSGLRRPGGEYR